MWKIKISPISICISTQTEIGSTVECRNSTQSVSISISICSRMAIVNSGCAQELPVPSRSLISLFHWYVSNGLGFAIIFSELRFNVRRPIQVFGKSLEFCRCCSCKSVHYQGSMGHITCIVVKVHRISLQPPKTNIKIKVNPTWPKFLWYVWLTRQKKHRVAQLQIVWVDILDPHLDEFDTVRYMIVISELNKIATLI